MVERLFRHLMRCALALPRLNAAWTLGDGEILVLGDSAASFDGRYFGPISARQVTASIKPVVTW